tara:strand:+ start:537 stop:794 length:258 start_codon:yes stop_codon:yes gene_type:complete
MLGRMKSCDKADRRATCPFVNLEGVLVMLGASVCQASARGVPFCDLLPEGSSSDKDRYPLGQDLLGLGALALEPVLMFYQSRHNI